jgi:hypothetical protein
MPSKSDKDKPTKEDTKGHATNAEGEILPPGSTVPAFPKDKEESDAQAEHRKNLRNLPPVPAERAGAASQAK